MNDILELFEENQSVLLLEDVTSKLASNTNKGSSSYQSQISDSAANIDFILKYCSDKNYNVYILCYQKEQIEILTSCSKFYITPTFVTYSMLDDMLKENTVLDNSCFVDYKCFRKCSSIENKTYQTIVNSKQLFTKNIFIDTIGENYLTCEQMAAIFGLVGYDNINTNNPGEIVKVLEDDFLYNKIAIINDDGIVKDAKKYMVDDPKHPFILNNTNKTSWFKKLMNKIKNFFSRF